MARRTKTCEFCEAEIVDTTEGRNRFSGSVEWYPDNGVFGVTAFAEDENGEVQEYELCSLVFEYCPMCGRKVGF